MGIKQSELLSRLRSLCGIFAEGKALKVDHILPRNRSGSDDISNLQALRHRCNAMKRDRDDTDFRGIVESYSYLSPYRFLRSVSSTEP